MSQPIGLSPEQLVELTGSRRNAKQIQALVTMEIAFRVRPDGSAFVSLRAIEPEPQQLTIAIPEPVLTLI